MKTENEILKEAADQAEQREIVGNVTQALNDNGVKTLVIDWSNPEKMSMERVDSDIAKIFGHLNRPFPQNPQTHKDLGRDI